MDRITSFNIELRNKIGTGSAREFRRNGKVPVNIYGKHVKENINALVDAKLLLFSYQQGCFFSRVFTLISPEKEFLVYAQDVATDPLTDAILNIDFLIVENDDVIKREIPVLTYGHDLSPCVKIGGKVNIVKRKILIEAKVEDMPEKVEINLEESETGTVFKVKDVISKSEKIKFIHPEAIIITFIGKRGSVSDEDLEAEEVAKEE